jgi:hypothetical protein
VLELIFRVALGGVLRARVLRNERVHVSGALWVFVEFVSRVVCSVRMYENGGTGVVGRLAFVGSLSLMIPLKATAGRSSSPRW